MTQSTVNTDETRAALTAAYWNLRRHADEYRDTAGFRKAHERWQANREDQRIYTKAAIHEFYAKGIEAAAREIAAMLGIPEHEIEPITQEVTPA
jgi:phage terminase large subunit-like protein